MIRHTIKIPRESIIPLYNNIERPTKRQKIETEGNIDIATVLTEIGTANYTRGDYHAAKECFSQALCQIDIDYIYSFVEIKAKDTTCRNKSLQSFSTKETTSLATNILATKDDYTKTINDMKSKPTPEMQGDDQINQHDKVEYDEGMRVYESPLQIEKTKSIGDIASILCYNIGQTYVQRKLYNNAIVWFHKSLDKFISAYDNDSYKVLSIVANLHSLAYSYYKVGQNHEAMTFYQRALDIILEHNLTEGTHLAASYNCLGVLLFKDQNDQSENSDLAMKMFLKSLDLYKSYQLKNKKNNNGDSDIFITREIATVLNNIGRVHYLQLNFKKALTSYKECLQLRQESVSLYSFSCDRTTISVDIAATAYNLGQTYHQLGHLDDALSYYNQFLNIMISDVVGFTRTLPFKDNALVYKGIAEIYHDKSDFKTSLHYYNKALQIQMAHSKKDGRYLPIPEVAETLNNIGNLCYEMKDFATAMRFYQQGLKIEKAVLKPNHQYIIVTTTNIGHIHKQFGQYSHALSAYQEVCRMQQEHFGFDSFVLAETLSSIGLMQYHLKKYESSFDSYQEALRIRREHLGTDDHPDIASTLNSIGLVLFRQKMNDTAKSCFEKSLRIRTKLLGKDHRDVAILWYNLATIHFESGEDELAIQMYKETLRVERLALGNDHPDVLMTLQHLGQVHQQLGLADKAIEYFNEALDIERNRRFKGDNNNNVKKEEEAKKKSIKFMAKILNLLGNVYLQLGKTSDMMECYIEASRIYKSNRSLGETVVIGGYNFYGLSKTNPPCAPVA